MGFVFTGKSAWYKKPLIKGLSEMDSPGACSMKHTITTKEAQNKYGSSFIQAEKGRVKRDENYIFSRSIYIFMVK